LEIDMANGQKTLWCGIGMVLGMVLTYCWLRPSSVARAADAHAVNEQGVQVLVDEKDMRTSYANAYRIHTAEQEAVIDFGLNMPNPNVKPGDPQQVLLKVNDRMVLSYVTVKRLSISLAQVVKRFEEKFGEIPTGGLKER
jgi:hypothetical protein